MVSAAVKLMTADEFLLWQQGRETGYELVDGIPVEMMTGASDVHDRVVINVIMLLGQQLRGTRCRPTTAAGAWDTSDYDRRADVIELDRLGSSLAMSAICDDTRLSEGEPTPEQDQP